MTARSADTKEIRRLEAEARASLAGRLEALRRKHGYTMSYLADSAQIGRGHLSNIFAAKANVGLLTLVKLAYALDVEPGSLLASNETAKPSFRRGRPRRRRISG